MLFGVLFLPTYQALFQSFGPCTVVQGVPPRVATQSRIIEHLLAVAKHRPAKHEINPMTKGTLSQGFDSRRVTP